MNNNLKYSEAQEHALTIKWKTSECSQGASCWCRIIEPEIEIKDNEENKIFIANSGFISKIFAEHIVNLHNSSLKIK